MRRKICFVVLGIGFSGAEKVLTQFLDNNAEVDPHIVVIYSGSVYSEFVSRYGEDKTSCLEVSYSRNGLRFFPFISEYIVASQLKKVVDEVKPELVYVNNTLEVMLCKKAAKSINVPFIAHVHDMKSSFGTIVKTIEVQRAFKCYCEILTVSEACKASWNYSSMKVIYNGVSSSYFNWSSSKGSISKIGYVGMISKRKGSDILFGIIDDMPKTVKWRIAYNLIEHEFKAKLDNLKSYQNVEIRNNISAEEIRSFYDSIDILVVPSRQDPLPTVVIEAMARGKIVIGFRIGGIPELIMDNDLIVNEISEAAMLHKINEIMSWTPEEVEETRKKLYERVAVVFNQKEKNNMVNKLIKNCIGH